MASSSYVGFECPVPDLYYAAQAWKQIRTLRLCRNRIRSENANTAHILNLPREILSMVEMSIAENIRVEAEAMPAPWTRVCDCPDPDQDSMMGLPITLEAFTTWLREERNIKDNGEHPYTRLDCLEILDEFVASPKWKELEGCAGPGLFDFCERCPGRYKEHWERVVQCYREPRDTLLSGGVGEYDIQASLKALLTDHGLDTLVLCPIDEAVPVTETEDEFKPPPPVLCRVASLARCAEVRQSITRLLRLLNQFSKNGTIKLQDFTDDVISSQKKETMAS